MTPIYLDHNATTPIDPAVAAAMEPYFTDRFGNASSVDHEHGHAAAAAVTESRQTIASAIGASPNEIIFTGSCTEANNLAILGAARARAERNHLIVSAVEHAAVLEPARALEREGWRLTILPVDAEGRVSPDQVAATITTDTALVSVMAANNEVGTIQPVGEIGSVCAAHDVLFHCDLAQAIPHVSINVARDNIHLASLSAHKLYGPKGIGALYVRSRRPRVGLVPLQFGGSQERGLRPGTLNTPAIVGMGKAISIAQRSAGKEAQRLLELSELFRERLMSHVPDALLNGDPANRLPNNLSIWIPLIEPLALMRQLRNDLSFSASSACATDKIETSHVLLAMFGDCERARQAFRIAPGRFTTSEQMLYAADLIGDTAQRLRSRAA